MVCSRQRKIDRGEKMRADTKKAWRPEKPFFIARRNRDVATLDGGLQAEPRRVPVVGRPIDQCQAEKEETPSTVLGHETDAEFAPLVIREQKIGRCEDEDEGPSHGGERPQKVRRVRYALERKRT